MSSQPETPATVEPAAHLLQLQGRIRAVPDNLVVVRLDLQSLCNSKTSKLSAEAKQQITDACHVLHEAITDVVDAAQFIDRCLASEGVRRMLSDDLGKPLPAAAARKRNGKESAGA